MFVRHRRTRRFVAAAIAWARHHFAEEPSAPRRVVGTTAGRVGYFEDDACSGIPVILFGDPMLFGALRSSRPVIAFDDVDDVRVVVELLADVVMRYGASPDVVATGAIGETVARGVARVPHLARSLATTRPCGSVPLPSCFVGVADRDPDAIASALFAFWSSLVPRPALRLVRGGKS